MDSPRLVRATWRHKVIERNGARLEMKDHELHALVNDTIEAVASVYVGGGRKMDYVTLNLGFEVPFIRRHIEERGLGR